MSYDLDQAERHLDSIIGDLWTWKRPKVPPQKLPEVVEPADSTPANLDDIRAEVYE